jgi:2-keto-4-pentenoate hydratase/2-oxohepta-3-ene-1,7-dioic acid hydratase in catechol pathway
VRLCRYGTPGREKPGLFDPAGKLRDLSNVIPDLTPDTLAPEALAKLVALRPESLPLVGGNPRMGVPVNGISKYIAIGLNYSDHAKEANMRVPSEPIIFMKATSCLCGFRTAAST